MSSLAPRALKEYPVTSAKPVGGAKRNVSMVMNILLLSRRVIGYSRWIA
jgi:hypothetical protein